MIPSLSGSLYKFDGENLDRIPFTIDSLLKSSFRYNDDLIISGVFKCFSHIMYQNLFI